MITGLQLATIWSEDIGNLLPFYRDTLGLTVGMDSPGFVIFGDPEVPALALGTHSDVRGRNGDPARHIVGLGTDDIQADYARIQGAGVEFVESPNVQGTVWIATLKDPEGNLVQLLQFAGAT